MREAEAALSNWPPYSTLIAARELHRLGYSLPDLVHDIDERSLGDVAGHNDAPLHGLAPHIVGSAVILQVGQCVQRHLGTEWRRDECVAHGVEIPPGLIVVPQHHVEGDLPFQHLADTLAGERHLHGIRGLSGRHPVARQVRPG